MRVIESPDRDVPLRAARIIAVVAGLLWLALTYPQLIDPRLDPSTRVTLPLLVALLAFAAAVPPVARAFHTIVLAPPARAFVVACATLSFAASLAIVAYPLRHQTLSIDSATYLFQARALAHGRFGMPLAVPPLAFGARFLFEGADGALHGVFPLGYPLFLAPFVRADIPMLAGPVTAALLVVSQYALARTLTRDESTARYSVLFSLPSFARAIESADLLSHAFVAVLASTAIAASWHHRRDPRARWAALAGVCVGWAFVSRLLDGFVLAIAMTAVFALGTVSRALVVRRLAMAMACAAPFVVLLALQQHAATGSAFVPTQYEYFARSDWPPSCHRLGFGHDIGCAVEHAGDRRAFGSRGYGLVEALRVTRLRAMVLGWDLYGLAPLALLAFVAAAMRARAGEAIAAVWIVGFTGAYALFYYGNAAIFGARHLFPTAPFVHVLLASLACAVPAREGPWFNAVHIRGGVALALLATIAVAQWPRWQLNLSGVVQVQSTRVDLDAAIRSNHVARGIVATRDTLGYIASYDPWRAPNAIFTASDDGSQLQELRRAHPTLPLYFALPGGALGLAQVRPPEPGLLVEIESAWPSFQRTFGLGASVMDSRECCRVRASGDHVLYVFDAHEGATLRIPIWVSRAGTYSLRVDGITGIDFGTYAVRLDRTNLPAWEGYAPDRTLRHGTPSPPIAITAGAHTLAFHCTGRDPASRGYLAQFDALVGTPAP